MRQTDSNKPEWEEVPAARDYVLKLIWRDPNKRLEGEVLKRLGGAYGVAEYLWHSDKLKQGAACHEPSATTCEQCQDATPVQPVQQASNLGDIDIEVPEEEQEGKEPQYIEVDTDIYTEELCTARAPRIYSWMLLLSVGRLLLTARDTRELLEAILDGILGYWHTLNRGILHRDISDGNVLIAVPGQSPPVPEFLERSEELLQNIVAKLSRNSRGFLRDYDLYSSHSGLGPWFFSQSSRRKGREPDLLTREDDSTLEVGPDLKRRKYNNPSSLSPIGEGQSRDQGPSEDPSWLRPAISGGKWYGSIDFCTGAPTFMSSRVLQIEPGEHYEHHFTDDLESFFWLIYWCIVQHTDPNRAPNKASIKLLDQPDPSDMKLETLAIVKHGVLGRCSNGAIYKDLESCKNTWVDDPAVARLIQQLGSHFSGVNDITCTRSVSRFKPEDQFPKVVGVILKAPEEMNSDSETSCT
ncbi:unnamed protein product [Rhizoctonia solani]|uniref:Fungal-type protein kinase domain-containing protein n=1 Tax=Rhizoctonia solani TaxID=456999 RepID=A0A8H3GXX3_9AGAM|nr:unnamed protein product [Rhizoctonia solani]